MRVALYPRVSTTEQANEGYSIGEQIERMTKYCEAQGWTVYKVYTDAGFTGANMNRPGLELMLHDASYKRFDICLVHKLDRLSRSQKDTLTIIYDYLLPNDIEFVSMTEHFATDSPTGRAMLSLIATFAQLERDMIKERTQTGREARAKAGLWHGSATPPTGYKYVGGKLEIDEYEALQIKELFRLHNMRIPPMRINKMLNEKGYRTSNGEWNRREYRPLISNRVYIGEVSYKGEWYPGVHKGIIELEVFEKAQKVLNERLEKHRRTPRYNSPISGLVKCGNCGANYYVETYYSRRDKNIKYRTFTCYARGSRHGEWGKIPKEKRCKNKNWKTEILEKLVLDEINKLALDPDAIESQEKPDENSLEISAITNRIIEIDAKLDRFLDLYDSGTYDLARINAKTEPLNEEKAQLTHRLSKLKSEPNMTKDEAVEIAKTIGDMIEDADNDEIRSMVHDLIDSIVIDEEKVHIYWNF